MSQYGTALNPGAPTARITHLDRLTRILEDSRKLLVKLGSVEQTLSPTPEEAGGESPGPYGVDSMTTEIERLVTFANASANRIAEYLGAK